VGGCSILQALALSPTPSANEVRGHLAHQGEEGLAQKDEGRSDRSGLFCVNDLLFVVIFAIRRPDKGAERLQLRHAPGKTHQIGP